MAGVLRRGELNAHYPTARVQRALDRLLTAPYVRVQTRPLLSDAWQLRYNHPIADALYVVLATHLGAPLVTSEWRMRPRLG